MKIYWTMNSVPELEGLEKAEKKRAFIEMQKHGRSRLGAMPWVWCFFFSALAIALVASVVPVLTGLGGVLLYGLVGGLVGFLWVILIQNPAIEHGRIWYREQQGQNDS